MPSRAAAVRELLKRGLAAEGFLRSDDRMQSKDYGVTDGVTEERRGLDAALRGWRAAPSRR